MKHVKSGGWQGDNQTARDRTQRLAQKQKPAGEVFSPAGLDPNSNIHSRVSESLADQLPKGCLAGGVGSLDRVDLVGGVAARVTSERS
jgi:hypothetical protein